MTSADYKRVSDRDIKTFFHVNIRCDLIEEFAQFMKNETTVLKAKSLAKHEPKPKQTRKRTHQGELASTTVKTHVHLLTPYPCLFCEETFADVESVYAHGCVNHFDVKPFVCKIGECTAKFINRQAASKHYEDYHPLSAMHVERNVSCLESVWLSQFTAKAYEPTVRRCVAKCHVCEKLYSKSQDEPPLVLNEVELVAHIQDHLSYCGKFCEFCSRKKCNYMNAAQAKLHMEVAHHIVGPANEHWKHYRIEQLENIFPKALDDDPLVDSLFNALLEAESNEMTTEQSPEVTSINDSTTMSVQPSVKVCNCCMCVITAFFTLTAIFTQNTSMLGSKQPTIRQCCLCNAQFKNKTLFEDHANAVHPGLAKKSRRLSITLSASDRTAEHNVKN